MPKRPEGPPATAPAEENRAPIDLNFLPENYLKRVNDIFDSYFGLGMRRSNTEMSGKYAPTFPADMASLNSSELGNRLGEYTAWYSFCADKYKYVVVASTFIDSEMDRAVDMIVGSMVADKGNIDAKKAKAKSGEEYLMLMSYHQKLTGLKLMLDNEMKNYDKCITSLSREISRREHTAGF